MNSSFISILISFKKEIIVVPNFVDLVKFRTQLNRCNEDNEGYKIITHVSNFRPVKNVRGVIDFFEKLSSKLKYLIFPYETVGNKYFMTSDFINELRNQNIEAIFYMRDWDKYAFPFANKGFFPFKKNISDLLFKNGIS